MIPMQNCNIISVDYRQMEIDSLKFCRILMNKVIDVSWLMRGEIVAEELYLWIKCYCFYFLIFS